MATDWRAFVRSQLPPLDVAPAREIEIVEELAAQLEATYARELAAGADEPAARQAAMDEVPDWKLFARSIGTVERPYHPPPVAGAGSGGLMTGLVQDVRCALRALRRAPGFAAVSIVTIALGIAAATLVYSIVDGILLRPLPIADGDRVMLVRESINGRDMSLAVPNYADMRARQTSFSSFAAWRGLTANLTGIPEARRLNIRHVTWDLLSTLGVTVAIGRDFTPADDTFGAERTAIVSDAFWQRELGGTPDALGRRIMLDESPVTIIGVLPKGFTIARAEDVFLPFGTFNDQSNGMYSSRGNHFGLIAVARLKPGVTASAAAAEMAGIARQLEQEYPATNSGNTAITQPLFETLVGTARPMLYVLLGAVITMLLIACVNLANLMLARAAGRAQEMAVRRSLGAARWRIARQLLTESVLLALIGGACGVLLAAAGFQTLLALLPPNQPRIHIIAIDLRVLAIASAASIGTGLLFGLMPAMHAATGRSMQLLRSTRVTSGGHASASARRMLLLSEVALALVLVAGAGLMLRTIRNLAAIDTGFSHDRIVTAAFSLPERYNQPKRVAFYPQVLERLSALPGVTHAAYAYSIPVLGSNWNSIFIAEGQPVPERSQLPSASWNPVSASYFQTMGIRLLRGRLFDARDVFGAPNVVVINETLARRMFGDNNPIGTRLKQGWPEDDNPWREIVGVVNDVRVNGLTADPVMQAYGPLGQMSQRSGSFLIRTAGDAPAMQRAMESAIHELDPNLPLFDVQTMEQVIDGSIGNERLTMVMLMAFAALALVIAAIGVFGVTAYSVAQRTHELGVRMALGAQPSSVLRLVLREEMGASLIGIAVGVAGALVLTRLLGSLLFGVTPRDTLTLAVAASVLLVVTALACLIPARRATRVDPMIALRLD